MTAIERAEALLAVATKKRGCEHYQRIANLCDSCHKWEAVKAAQRQLVRLGFSPNALRGYIDAIKALERITRHPVATPVAGRRDVGLEPWLACQEIAQPPVADFERLFPEAPASAD
jgi:hypothetical protein